MGAESPKPSRRQASDPSRGTTPGLCVIDDPALVVFPLDAVAVLAPPRPARVDQVPDTHPCGLPYELVRPDGRHDLVCPPDFGQVPVTIEGVWLHGHAAQRTRLRRRSIRSATFLPARLGVGGELRCR